MDVDSALDITAVIVVVAAAGAAVGVKAVITGAASAA